MKLEISAKDSSGYEAVKTTTFVFHVYPESYWEPLAIASNNSILVEESTSIAITRDILTLRSRNVNFFCQNTKAILSFLNYCIIS